jgi:O-antigen/teichoic acid export membrane protein
MSSRTRRAINGSVTGLLQHFITMLFQLILAPLILAKSGQETLGGYAVVLQIIGYGILLDFGFSVAWGRYLARAHSPNNCTKGDKRFSALLTVGRNVLFVTNLLFAVALIGAALNIQYLLKGSSAIHSDAQFALYMMAGWAVVRTPLYIYTTALNASQDMATLNFISIGANIFRLMTTLGFVFLGLGISGLVAAIILSELLATTVQWFIFRRWYPMYRTDFAVGNIRLGKEMVRFGIKYWGVNLSVVFLLGSDNLIIGTLYGAAAASVFFTTKMFASLLITLVSRILDNVSPGLNQLIGTGDFEAARRVYLRLLRYTMILALPAALGTYTFLDEFVTLWVGHGQFAGDFVAVALAITVFVQVMAHLHGLTALALGNNIDHWSWFSAFVGAIAVAAGYLLGKKYGMAWIPLSLAGATFGIWIFLGRLVTKQMQITGKLYFQSLKPAFVSITPLLVFLALKPYFFESNEWLSVLGSVVVFTIAWASGAWLFGMTESERRHVQKLFQI